MQDLYQKGKNGIPLTVTDNKLFINICWILRVKVMFQPKKNVALTRVLVSAPRKFLRFTAWMAEQAFLSSWKTNKILINTCYKHYKNMTKFCRQVTTLQKVAIKNLILSANPVSHNMVYQKMTWWSPKTSSLDIFFLNTWARSIQPKFRPVRPGKEDHLKRWTSFFETFPVGPNRSTEFWTEISGNFGWMDRAPCAVRNMKDTKRRNSILILPDGEKKNKKEE